MSDKVYIVTSGAYSDFCNEAVYTDRAKAEEHHKFLEESGEHTGIEEWELNDMPGKIEQGLKCYLVIMYGNGDVKRVERQAHGSYFFPPKENEYWYCGWAKSEKHVIKIANEKRIQHKAKQ